MRGAAGNLAASEKKSKEKSPALAHPDLLGLFLHPIGTCKQRCKVSAPLSRSRIECAGRAAVVVRVTFAPDY